MADIVKGIQTGAITHHQDQSITLHNFKIMNATNSKLKTPDPPEFDSLLIVLFYWG